MHQTNAPSTPIAGRKMKFSDMFIRCLLAFKKEIDARRVAQIVWLWPSCRTAQAPCQRPHEIVCTDPFSALKMHAIESWIFSFRLFGDFWQPSVEVFAAVLASSRDSPLR
jgi:hypothetical protein